MFAAVDRPHLSDSPSAPDAPPADAPGSDPRAAAAHYRFRLFVAGETPLSVQVRANFDRYIAGPLGDRVELEVVDLAANPRIAREERIVATPTLVRLEPTPVVRLIGDLGNFHRVRSLALVGADRPAAPPPPPHGSARGHVVRRPEPAHSDAGPPPGAPPDAPPPDP